MGRTHNMRDSINAAHIWGRNYLGPEVGFFFPKKHSIAFFGSLRIFWTPAFDLKKSRVAAGMNAIWTLWPSVKCRSGAGDGGIGGALPVVNMQFPCHFQKNFPARGEPLALARIFKVGL